MATAKAIEPGRQMTLTAVIVKDGDFYVGWLAEIPGVATQGEAMDELRENLADVLSMMNEHRLEETLKKAGPDAIIEPMTFTL